MDHSFKFSLGEEVEDMVTGFKGFVVNCCACISFCNSYYVQRPHKKGTKIENAEYFDETRLKATGKKLKNIIIPALDKGAPKSFMNVK